MRIVAVIPTRTEFDAFVEACRDLGYPGEPGVVGRLSVSEVAALGLAVACGGLGKVQFAVQTQHLIDAGCWDLVICAGAAGALVPELAVGDVVVADETVEHDVWNRIGRPRVPRFRGAEHALAQCRRILRAGTPVTVHYGAIASGDEDVVDDERRAAIRARTNALAVAWEGAGGARACQFSGVPFLEIRGVTDGADGAAPRDFGLNVKRALQSVALVVVALARSAGRPGEEAR
jgi:adenosylhomocysteine nucleosidase